MEFRASEAFVRGLTGKEEPASKARLVVSPEPLPNEMKKYGRCIGCAWRFAVWGFLMWVFLRLEFLCTW